jgi:hypothetical protein
VSGSFGFKVLETGFPGELDVIVFAARFLGPFPTVAGPFLELAHLVTQAQEIKLLFRIRAFRKVYVLCCR